MSEISDRIAFLMKSKGLDTLADAARAYGIPYEAFKKIASPNTSDPRGLTPENARKIARHHKVPAGWLVFNEGRPERLPGIPLLGKIGAGQEMMLFETPGNEDPIPSDFVGPDALAFEIEGDSMRPVAHNGDIAFFGPARRDLEHLIGVECAVLLQDGRRFFKIIERGARKGLYDLVSHNAGTIRDVEVHSAGPLLAVRRRPSRIAKSRRR
jgi:hypothetical protein